MTAIHKIIYLLWAPPGMSRRERRIALVEGVAPIILRADPRGLSLLVADDRAQVPSPAPAMPLSDPPIGALSLWVDALDARWPAEDTLRARGFELAGYEVEASVYTEYGDNPYAECRNWAPGARSPGVVTLNLLQRPGRLSHDEWKRRWFERMSPVSAELQPRARYVRNVVTQTLTKGAPRWDGLVEEAWPTIAHLTDKRLFYGADSPWQLVRNMARIMGAVTSFIDLWRFQAVPVSEYLWHSPDARS